MAERDEPEAVTEMYDQNARHGIGQQEPLDVEQQRRDDAKARKDEAEYSKVEYARVRGRLSGELSMALRIFRMAHARELSRMGKDQEQRLVRDVIAEVMASEAMPNDPGLAGNQLGDPADSGIMDDPDKNPDDDVHTDHPHPAPKGKK